MAILWIFCRLSFITLILWMIYSVLTQNIIIFYYTQLLPCGMDSCQEEKVYLAVPPLLPLTRLSWAAGGHTKHLFTPVGSVSGRRNRCFAPRSLQGEEGGIQGTSAPYIGRNWRRPSLDWCTTKHLTISATAFLKHEKGNRSAAFQDSPVHSLNETSEVSFWPPGEYLKLV